MILIFERRKFSSTMDKPSFAQENDRSLVLLNEASRVRKRSDLWKGPFFRRPPHSSIESKRIRKRRVAKGKVVTHCRFLSCQAMKTLQSTRNRSFKELRKIRCTKQIDQIIKADHAQNKRFLSLSTLPLLNLDSGVYIYGNTQNQHFWAKNQLRLRMPPSQSLLPSCLQRVALQKIVKTGRDQQERWESRVTYSFHWFQCHLASHFQCLVSQRRLHLSKDESTYH